jgi:serine/threonine protein kinase
VADEELGEGEDKLAIVIERQLSYFSSRESFQGLFQYLGDNPWTQVSDVIAPSFGEENLRAPLALWKDIDPEFKDLVVKLTTVDKKKRIAAQEALSHRWFADAMLRRMHLGLPLRIIVSISYSFVPVSLVYYADSPLLDQKGVFITDGDT